MRNPAERADRFTWQPGDVALSQCALCRHLDAAAPRATCPAFPAGVPDAILRNRADHRRRDPGQRRPSVLFTPKPGIHPAALAALYRTLNSIE